MTIYLEMELLSSSESSVMDEMRPDTDETDDRLEGTVVTENDETFIIIITLL